MIGVHAVGVAVADTRTDNDPSSSTHNMVDRGVVICPKSVGAELPRARSQSALLVNGEIGASAQLHVMVVSSSDYGKLLGHVMSHRCSRKRLLVELRPVRWTVLQRCGGSGVFVPQVAVMEHK